MRTGIIMFWLVVAAAVIGVIIWKIKIDPEGHTVWAYLGLWAVKKKTVPERTAPVLENMETGKEEFHKGGTSTRCCHPFQFIEKRNQTIIERLTAGGRRGVEEMNEREGAEHGNRKTETDIGTGQENGRIHAAANGWSAGGKQEYIPAIRTASGENDDRQSMDILRHRRREAGRSFVEIIDDYVEDGMRPCKPVCQKRKQVSCVTAKPVSEAATGMQWPIQRWCIVDGRRVTTLLQHAEFASLCAPRTVLREWWSLPWHGKKS